MIGLALLFIVLPMAELALLIEVGRRIGTLPTLGIIVTTGVLGAYLARRQGLGVLRQVQRELGEGRLPLESIADGVMILLAGVLLVTPGILTDLFGFLCLVPPTRRVIRRFLWALLAQSARSGRVKVSFDARGSTRGGTGPHPPPASHGTVEPDSPRLRDARGDSQPDDDPD